MVESLLLIYRNVSVSKRAGHGFRNGASRSSAAHFAVLASTLGPEIRNHAFDPSPRA